MPAYDIGAAHIRVDGHTVGVALGTFTAWQAHLWPVADQRFNPRKAETVTRPTLRDLRTELRRRLAEQGPWWTEEDTDNHA
jgi:hypothetical protein